MNNDYPIIDEVFAQAIGREALRYFKSTQILDRLVQNAKLDALSALSQIKLVLEDQALDDPECF